eukprot:2745873-Pleurochrysis_carterae.AAC.1
MVFCQNLNTTRQQDQAAEAAVMRLRDATARRGRHQNNYLVKHVTRRLRQVSESSAEQRKEKGWKGGRESCGVGSPLTSSSRRGTRPSPSGSRSCTQHAAHMSGPIE